jgi:ribosomal protein S18 acetylase RimI-like enzyme
VAYDRTARLVAVDDLVIVGSVIAAWDGWRGSIYRLVVTPSHRRQGLARRLVVEDDAPATGFWRSSGWEQQSERLRFVRG